MNWNWKNMGLGASLVSILGSIAIYFAHDENLGIFVGPLGICVVAIERPHG